MTEPLAAHNKRLLDLLTHVGQIVSSSKSLETMLLATVNLIRNVLDVERCSILIIDPVTHALRLKAASNIPPEEWEKVRVRVGEGISGHVAQTGKPLLVENIAASEFARLAQTDRYSTTSFISVPLLVKSRTIGVINVNNCSDLRRFSREDLDLMVALSGLIALAIDNSRLMSVSDSIRTQLESILESLPQAVFSLSRDGKVTLCNLRFVRLLGLDADSPAEDRQIEELLPEPLLKTVTAMQRETLEYGTEVRREALFTIGSPVSTPFEITMTPLTDDSGSLSGVLATVQDLSMRQEIAELRRLDELKSRFLSLVSHELRTPLTSIKGAVHLLMNPTGSEAVEPTRSLAGIVHKNTERLIRLVNDLLEMVNVENHTLTIMPRLENLQSLLQTCIDKEKPTADAKGVYLHADLDDVSAVVDRARMIQAVGYLLDNAVKFTPRGGHVRVGVETGDDRAYIMVDDTGCGVSADAQDKIFGKFYQAQNPLTRSCGGTGVGLFLARSIVELHGGQISLSSQPDGNGTRFTIELPLRDGVAVESR